jgi:fucose 4-O-acetylase-like acetyltransferase
VLLAVVTPLTIDLHARQHRWFPVSTLGALLGILFTLAISKQIEPRFRRLSSSLAYIGGASLFILIFHLPIQEFWNGKILALTDSQLLATLTAFLISVGLSLAFFKVFVERNPVASFFFGRKTSPVDQPDKA